MIGTVQTEKGELMIEKLDYIIGNMAYILDTLITYRDIVNSGDCNECKIKLTCKYVPQAGQLTRYNCPHFQRKKENR